MSFYLCSGMVCVSCGTTIPFVMRVCVHIPYLPSIVRVCFVLVFLFLLFIPCFRLLVCLLCPIYAYCSFQSFCVNYFFDFFIFTKYSYKFHITYSRTNGFDIKTFYSFLQFLCNLMYFNVF